MTKNMVACGVFAGFAAGLIAVLLQFWLVQPVLLHAELYESGELAHFGGPAPAEAAHDHGAHDHGGDHTDGHGDDHSDGHGDEHAHSHSHDHGEGGSELARNGLTMLFSALIYAGYGLMLVAAFALARTRGIEVTSRTGIIWGVAGFIAVQLAPAVGLPPELPGMAAADVTGRQIWWAGTAIATAAGLWLIAFGNSWAQWGLGILLILIPQLIGAPHPLEFSGPTPPELASEFAARALGTGLAAWACLGLIAAWLWQKELF